MGVGTSFESGLVTGISAVVMALSAVAAGYCYSLWREFPTTDGAVFGAALAALRPLVPALFAVSVGLFVLATVTVVYCARGVGDV